MSIRRNHVSELITAAQQHDALVSIKGWKADSDTDDARATYERLREQATPAERELFDRIYM